MRLPPLLLVLPFVLGLISWLSLSAINVASEPFDDAFGALNSFSIAESGLHRDVLRARAGILRSYDPLTRNIHMIDDSLSRLREIAVVDAESSAAIDRLADSAATEEALVEQFKTNNALLQNSLAYFEMISARLGGANPAGPLVSPLAAAVLHLTLDTSSSSTREVGDRLDDLAKGLPLPDHTDLVKALLAHGRLLDDLLPKTDRTLKALFAVPLKANEEAVRALILARQNAAWASARWYRIALYVTSLLLVALLLRLALQLREHVRAAQRRAALEHAIAGMSMRFVTTRAEDLDANIDQALADLGKCVGADRVYFSLSGPPERLHTWRREGSDFPPDWPQKSLALAALFEQTPDGIVHVFNVNRLPPGMNRDLCVRYGLKGFGCIADADADGGSVVLWLDCLRQPCLFTRSYEIGLLRMVRDILVTAVDRQVMEKERTRLEARLQRARRMETIGALTSGIAHNFNNIVGAILGYTEMAETHARASEPARYLGEIRRAGERAQDLVDQILTFGRSRDARWRPVRVQDLLDESASLLRASLPRGIELEIRRVPASAVVRAEPSQLQQVILNLCNNAAQAMGETGRIEIDTHLHEVVRQRSLSHGEISRGRYVCIAVTDTGQGIDEAILARIFDPFFTTRAAGNGLGLATVLEIVSEHGGAMNVHSVRGVGSRFEAWLASIVEVDDAQNQDLSALPLGYGDTVLIVSDQRARLLRDEEILAALGYEPVGFGPMDDALTACRRAPSRFDALLIGHAVSTQAALDFASAVRHIAPSLPILLATPSAEEIDANALLVAGVTEVVGCPLESGEIAAALARCLAGGQVVALQA